MARLRSGNAPTPARPTATRRSILREKTNTTATPAQAVETSILALKNFKRRPRQGSMLEMVRKRRSSVQQSLVNAQPQEEMENTSVFDLGSASEGEEDFVPEAEGTPVQLKKTAQKPVSMRKSAPARKSTTPATKRNKRKSDELETSHSALDALRKKHRKSEAPPVEDEPLPPVDDEHQAVVHPTSEHDDSPLPNASTSDVQVVNSSPDSTPPTEPSSSRRIAEDQEEDFAVPSTEEQERRQHASHMEPREEHADLEDEDDLDTPNATMAEPASSSPMASPIPETQRTDIFADPLTQISPPPPELPRTRNKGNNKQPTAVSTATLRALLPKRTQRPKPRPRRTEYDISSDDEEDDTAIFETTHLSENEDELGGRLRRRQSKASAPPKGKRKTAAKSKQATSTARNKLAAPPPPTKSKGKGKGKAKGKPMRTYGRAGTSDKENESGSDEQDEGDGVDTSMSMRDVAHSKELEEARRKFAEVDDWDLSFESMSNEDHRSSSQNWR